MTGVRFPEGAGIFSLHRRIQNLVLCRRMRGAVPPPSLRLHGVLHVKHKNNFTFTSVYCFTSSNETNDCSWIVFCTDEATHVNSIVDSDETLMPSRPEMNFEPPGLFSLVCF